MADQVIYKSIGEKYEAITAGKRQRHGMVWLTNGALNELPAQLGNPVLVEVPERQFAKEGNPWKKQGYTKYVHAKPAPAPIEAKHVEGVEKADKSKASDKKQ